MGKLHSKNLQIIDFAKLTTYDLKVTSGLISTDLHFLSLIG